MISIPISGDDENLVTPCPLAVGTYPYRVLLSEGGAETFDPQLTLEGAVMVGEPANRHVKGRTFTMAVRLLAFRGIEDTQCGFKLFRTEVAHDVFGRLKVYGNVAMANVFLHLLYVMDQVNFVTQDGLLTVLMVQMKA